MSALCAAYERGEWVPSYYGLKFTVAHKTPGRECDQDCAFIVATLAEAEAEAARRNTGGDSFTKAVADHKGVWLSTFGGKAVSA